MKIFLDTSFLVAFYNKEDKNHTQARNFMANADQSLSCLISDYIFDEILTVLLVRGGKALLLRLAARSWRTQGSIFSG
ncbi:MAG: PIN domain-containing protein [Deltaproteobacteria bacterium]|nr:PIN domain-containing protein [Deltaproteobacteria bacterium]